MSLDYELSGIDNWRETCLDDTDSIRPVTEVLIFGTLSVGLGKITESNVAEWVARFAIIEAIDGPSLITPDGPKSVDEDHIAAHIGLKTNVPDMTRLAWLRQQIGRRADERKTYAQRHYNRKKEPTNG